MLIATIVQAALVCSNHNRRNLAGQTEDLVVQLACGLLPRLQLLLRGTGSSLLSGHVPNTRSRCELRRVVYLRHPGLSRFSLAHCLPCGTDRTTKLKSSLL